VASERLIIFLVGAVQFVNILDFMMVMPLGPDFAAALGISTAHLGIIGGSYTAAAAVAGIVAARFLDRYDRRRALAVAITGLVIGTAAGAFARGLTSLVAARVIAGAFGGPATSIALSIIADVVPPARRGHAMGAVMGAFSAASVLGVPAGLELARHAGWRAPFVAVAALGIVVVVLALRAMPSLRGHIAAGADRAPSLRLRSLLADPTVRLGLLVNASVMMAAFLVIPNIAAHLQQNLGYPRSRLGLLYMIGGAASFFVVRIAGHAIDRFGAAAVSAVGTAGFMIVLYLGYIAPGAQGGTAVLLLFVGFMLAMSVRNVAMVSLSSRVPRADQRAGYMSLQSTAQHVSSATGAFVSSQLLHDAPGGRLDGIDTVSWLAFTFAIALPPLLAAIGRRVRARETAPTDAVAAPSSP
jgi:predicted MFS family arabinose efflux permease